MKKFTALVVILLMAGALFAQTKSLDKNNAYYIYFKGTNTKISETEYLNYAKVIEYETYDKYNNDEFEWDEQFTLLKQKLDKNIEDADLDSVYTVVTGVEFGDYDFANEGFPVSIGEGTFFPLETFYRDYEATRDSLFRKEIAFKLDSFEKYNFIAMPKADAKTFLQSRKSNSGYVNRNITLQITYKLAKFDSKEYKAFKDLALSNGYLPIVGIIEKIEVYDASNSRNVKKIGELTKK